jgi:hypothetical protein
MSMQLERWKQEMQAQHWSKNLMEDTIVLGLSRTGYEEDS